MYFALTRLGARVRHATRSVLAIVEVNLSFAGTFDSDRQTSRARLTSVDVEVTCAKRTIDIPEHSRSNRAVRKGRSARRTWLVDFAPLESRSDRSNLVSAAVRDWSNRELEGTARDGHALVLYTHLRMKHT